MSSALKRKRKWLLLIPVLALLWPVTVASVRICCEMRQDGLNHDLIEAVRQLDVTAVDRLLTQGANANAIDSTDAPRSLFDVIVQFVERLHNRRSSAPAMDKMPVLQTLFSAGRLYKDWDAPTCDAIAASLVHHNANINLVSEENMSILHLASSWGMHDTLRAMLEKGANANSRSRYERTPLMWADAENTNTLLEYHADVNARDEDGLGVLGYAVESGNAPVMKILIEHDANVNVSDAEGFSVLYRARTCKHRLNAVIDLLKENGARLNADGR